MPSTMWGHSENMLALNQSEGPHQKVTMPGPWSRLPGFWTVSNKFLLCKDASSMLFCYRTLNGLRKSSYLNVNLKPIPNHFIPLTPRYHTNPIVWAPICAWWLGLDVLRVPSQMISRISVVSLHSWFYTFQDGYEMVNPKCVKKMTLMRTESFHLS